MTSSKCILACIDGSELGNAVTEHAIWLAKTNGQRLKFIHTIEHSHIGISVHREGAMVPNMAEQLLGELSEEEQAKSKALIAEGKVIIKQAMQKAEEAGLTDSIAKQRHGSLKEALDDLKDEYQLVVLGARGVDHSDDQKGLGAQLENAIRTAECPVFIVKGEFKSADTVLFAYNGSPTSKKALEAIKNSPFINANQSLHLVSVAAELSQAQQLVDEATAILAGTEVKLVKQALTGEPCEAILAYQTQNNIDNIAMGAFSHGKLHGFFFGSFTTKMLLESSANFILVR